MTHKSKYVESRTHIFQYSKSTLMMESMKYKSVMMKKLESLYNAYLMKKSTADILLMHPNKEELFINCNMIDSMNQI